MIVLDASALVDVLVNQPWRDRVLDHLDQEILAPAHQPAEVISALGRLARAGTISQDDVHRGLDELTSLAQELVLPGSRELRRAYELAERLRILDGLYVALAEARGCALLTTDRRLAASRPPCQVLLVEP